MAQFVRTESVRHLIQLYHPCYDDSDGIHARCNRFVRVGGPAAV